MCLGWVYVNEVPAKAKSSGHELPAVGWAQDSGPLQEQKALLTTELLSRPRIEIFWNEKNIYIIFIFTHICECIYIYTLNILIYIFMSSIYVIYMT